MPDENEEPLALENPDVKPEDAAPSPAPDVTPDSSPEAPTMLEVAQAVVKEHGEDEGSVTPEDTTSPEGEVEPEEEEEDASELDPKDAQLPFAKHERFRELLAKSKERDAYETRVKELEPVVQKWEYHRKFLEQHGIADAEVQMVMNALAYSKVDPAKAREVLKPLWESLGDLDPNILPPDLQEKVKEGDITEEFARRLWKAECNNKLAAVAGTHAAKSQAQLRTEAIASTITSWERSTVKNNPDFKPSKDPKNPGLLEVTRAFYTQNLAAAIGGGQPETPQLHQQLLDKSLADAKALFSNRLRGQPTRLKPNSRLSSGAARPRSNKAFDPDREIAEVAAKYGYNFERNGEGEE